MAGFCRNSNRWLDFLFVWCPKTCPYENEGCIYEQCEYYEERNPTRWYKKKAKILYGFYSLTDKGKAEISKDATNDKEEKKKG